MNDINQKIIIILYCNSIATEYLFILIKKKNINITLINFTL